MSRHRRQANMLLVGAIAGLGVLYWFPPEEHGFYPACPVFRFAHVYCPGCGATRALAALLHGRLADALSYNPLFVFMLPFLLQYAAAVYWSAVTERHVRWPSVPTPALGILLLIAGVFAVVRNI